MPDKGDFAERGEGELFVQPDAEGFRGHNRTRPRGLVDKRTDVAKAVSSLVGDGDYVAVGGFGTNRIPTAVIHEMVRQKKRRLGLSGHTATHDFQVLAAGGCLDRCDVAYVIGLEARGLSPVSRRLFEEGNIRSTEWTNGALAWRYKAAAMGVPFLPARVMLGTDTFRYSSAETVRCPFTDMELLAVPALCPDVGIIHVHRADRYGNCQIDGITVSDLDLARASKRLIVTAERLIPHQEIRRRPERTAVPFFLVDAVIEVPYGSYPGNMPYEYYSDEEHLMEWMTAEREGRLEEFLATYVYGVKEHWEYVDLCGGIGRMQELRRQEVFPDEQ